ncbi:MAG: GNAT family N-acetyltransferase [Christensenellales bacterium]|jgi:PhnB protein
MGVSLNFNFHGQCADALALYAHAFDAAPDVIVRYSDANPADQARVPEGLRDRVYHAEMRICGLRAMFSDSLQSRAPDAGQTLGALLTFDTPAEVQSAYRALREGAQIVHPMCITTYSACMATLIDRFGVRWSLMTETPPAYRVRRAGFADAGAVAEVLAYTWGEAYAGLLSEEALARQTDVARRRKVVEANIERPGHITLVMEKGGAVCGMAGMRPAREGVVEIEAIYLRASEWGQGAGRYLMDHARAAAREAGYKRAELWVLQGNARAIHFYETCGFAHTGEAQEIALMAADGASHAVELRYAMRL